MKKALCAVVLALVIIFSLCACGAVKNKNSEKLSVVAVLFAEYDLARQVSGGLCDVKMLLPPGGESHTYDPAPQDIIAIENADIFICGGGESEEWIETVLSSVDAKKTTVLKMMDICEVKEEEIAPGMQEEKGEESSEPEYDEHVWTSPVNAVKILDEIEKTLCLKDEKNCDAYHENAEKYREEIEKLDIDFRTLRETAVRDTLIFADRFPMRYFTDEYNFGYYAAFPGCMAQSEPSAKTVKFLIDKVKEEKIPAVFTIEFSNGAIAQAINDETGAKILKFHSCHNVTKKEFARGETYVSLMRQNLENLKEAVNK